MENLLQEFIVGQAITLMLVFARLGTTLMIMPGIGDGYVSGKVRLLFALAFSFAMLPVLGPYMPENVRSLSSAVLIWMLMGEMMIGFLIGMVARIFMSALDTAGMLMSMQTGLGNAMVFNPQMSGQGSIIGALLSVTGMVLLFAANLHHIMIYAMIDSYQGFPVASGWPAADGMAQMIVTAVNQSFTTGFMMSIPFIIVSLMLYLAMGVLGRLMPQIQVFILALPIQLTLGFLVLIMVFSSVMLYWMNQFDEGIGYFLTNL